MALSTDFKAFQDKVTSSLVNATRTAGQISNEDLGFHRSSSSELSQAIDAQNTRLLQLTNRLLKAAAKDSSVRAPKLSNLDDVEENWRGIVDVVDDLLEKSDAALDEYTGILKRLSPVAQEGPAQKKQKITNSSNMFSGTLSKPQLHFRRQVDNHEVAPFKPLLKTKPHARVSLGESIGPGGSAGYKHPYAAEIESSQYPPATYVSAPPIQYSPAEESRAIFVDTEEAMHAMLAELKLAKEIAVDLEHHDQHSYIGMVCLMQISTRQKDWIVDTLKPWREDLQVLNEVFADPSILKVFHGSTSDMIWLQRDLGLYVVGLFDTFHASVALNFQPKSLKYLLERFANFHANKKFQLADWRVRPLPEELLDYARSDTHYLLYIYDNVRNMLIEASLPTNNLIDYVLEKSKEEALQVYERPVYDAKNGIGPGGWFKLLTSRAMKLTNTQFGVFRAVHQWRDMKARELDEGEASIMFQNQLWTIAQEMPTSVPALYTALRPVSAIVSKNAKELVEVIKRGKDDGTKGPSVQDVTKRNEEEFGVTPFRARRSKQNPNQTTISGVGDTLRMMMQSEAAKESKSQSEDVAMNDLPIASRATGSQLWGSILPRATTFVASSLSTASHALRSILPLPAKVSQLEVSDRGSGPVSIPLEIAAPKVIMEESPQHPPKADEIFVIREAARLSRKRKAYETELSSNQVDLTKSTASQADAENIIASLNNDPIIAARKDKARRKEAKRLRKEAEAAQNQAAAEAAVPFNYANAESVLHAKNDGDAAKSHGTKGNKGLSNLYAKALDTTTGAKRQRKEGPGKSYTFTS